MSDSCMPRIWMIVRLLVAMRCLTLKVKLPIETISSSAMLCLTGALKTCTRFALAKSIADGMMRKIFVSERRIDIAQDQIKTALLNVHKVRILITRPLYISLINSLGRMRKGSGRRSLTGRVTSCRTLSPTTGESHSPWGGLDRADCTRTSPQTVLPAPTAWCTWTRPLGGTVCM